MHAHPKTPFTEILPSYVPGKGLPADIRAALAGYDRKIAAGEVEFDDSGRLVNAPQDAGAWVPQVIRDRYMSGPSGQASQAGPRRY